MQNSRERKQKIKRDLIYLSVYSIPMQKLEMQRISIHRAETFLSQPLLWRPFIISILSLLCRSINRRWFLQLVSNSKERNVRIRRKGQCNASGFKESREKERGVKTEERQRQRVVAQPALKNEKQRRTNTKKRIETLRYLRCNC